MLFLVVMMFQLSQCFCGLLAIASCLPTNPFIYRHVLRIHSEAWYEIDMDINRPSEWLSVIHTYTYTSSSLSHNVSLNSVTLWNYYWCLAIWSGFVIATVSKGVAKLLSTMSCILMQVTTPMLQWHPVLVSHTFKKKWSIVLILGSVPLI